MTFSFRVEGPFSKSGCHAPVTRYITSITDIKKVKEDCCWGESVLVEIAAWDEDITPHKVGFLSLYTYQFSAFGIDPVILDFCWCYQVNLGQVHPSFWHVVYMIRHYSNIIEGMPFTLNHLIRMYSPRLLCGCLIRVHSRASSSDFAPIQEFRGDPWLSRFIQVRTSDMILVEKMPFPKEWNAGRT